MGEIYGFVDQVEGPSWVNTLKRLVSVRQIERINL